MATMADSLEALGDDARVEIALSRVTKEQKKMIQLGLDARKRVARFATWDYLSPAEKNSCLSAGYLVIRWSSDAALAKE